MYRNPGFFQDHLFILILIGLAGLGILVGLFFTFPKCPHCGKRIGKGSTTCPACKKDLREKKG